MPENWKVESLKKVVGFFHWKVVVAGLKRAIMAKCLSAWEIRPLWVIGAAKKGLGRLSSANDSTDCTVANGPNYLGQENLL